MEFENMFSCKRMGCWYWGYYYPGVRDEDNGSAPWKKTARPSSKVSPSSTTEHRYIWRGLKLWTLPDVGTTRRLQTCWTSGPETRTTATPPFPGGVESAYIVWFWDGARVRWWIRLDVVCRKTGNMMTNNGCALRNVRGRSTPLLQTKAGVFSRYVYESHICQIICVNV